MALQSSGSISFSQIANEFGFPPGKNLGAYRVSQTFSGLTNRPLDDGIPTSGTIRFSDFYGKKLNVVVDCTPTGGFSQKVMARNRYNNNNRTFAVGGFRTRPSSSSGVKVWIHNNGLIGSDQNSRNVFRRYSSLLTGDWEFNTDLRVDIGPSGYVTGGGGDGGNGGSAGRKYANVGTSGYRGTTGLGVQYSPVIITNRGRIQGGGGGGGGGGGSWNENRRRNERDLTYAAGGGGGGGGWGLPGGNGGSGGGSFAQDGNAPGQAGGSGSLSGAGRGGNGGRTARDSAGGGGGGGTNGLAGSNGFGAQNGSIVSGGNGGTGQALGGNDGRRGTTAGGSGFLNGFSILIFNNGSGVSIQNNNTIIGEIGYNIYPD